MKILALSDSHSSLNFMRMAINAVKPDAVVHLGDHYQDAQAMQEEYPHIHFHMVPGNCDQFLCQPNAVPVMCYAVCSVRVYMTHGHLHGVKMDTYRLERDARQANAQIALYGHTHQADCRQEGDLWIMNPGEAKYGGSAGLIEAQEGKIITCRILRQVDLEEYK